MSYKSAITASQTLNITQTDIPGMASKLYITVSVTGSATCSISLKHLDGIAISVATGVTGAYDTYVINGCTEVEIEETGGSAGNVAVSVSGP